jgi:hypothetical protein
MDIFDRGAPLILEYQQLYFDEPTGLFVTRDRRSLGPDPSSLRQITIRPFEQRHYGILQLVHNCSVSEQPRPKPGDSGSHIIKSWLEPEIRWLEKPEVDAVSSLLKQENSKGTTQLYIRSPRMAVLVQPDGKMVKGELDVDVHGALILLRQEAIEAKK